MVHGWGPALQSGGLSQGHCWLLSLGLAPPNWSSENQKGFFSSFLKNKIKMQKKNKEKDKSAFFKIPNPPYPTRGGQPTNSQTCSESFPKFIVLHATDNRKLSNASPFLISKAVHGSAGSVKSIKKLPSGDLLIETATQA
ncbi:hypothetical protein TNCV_3922921 [Trichonephila clavipes]|nr:hypothetical protein TNCV_3922921 [Trichonephila clavipes]